MDVSALISPLFNLFLYVIPAAIIIGLFKSPWFKGKMGEFLVNVVTKVSLDKYQYHLIKDVTLPTEEGGTTQIDHIVVSPYGVFVVETKNMQGWIFGGEFQKQWTQQLNKHSKFSFQNPLYQNHKHVKTLQNLLNLTDEQIHSVVVFIGTSEFKTKMPENVTYGLGYVRFIKSKTERVLSWDEFDSIIEKIESGRLARSIIGVRVKLNPTRPGRY
ncbi:nuclease-related domain-containing protein [Thiomicrorhabdus lithotrophica]|uniref:NERD domain-containing protein n=1 Tax=Thiomicrorhabdus lithotrophica TaxID=2949997 RepID=A0ABY8CHG6_9GAMM|nr:nuclease-related domain-containing protein [Thiomicrorhabdus lithotrophica]WEJ63603.1 NERD domain-containing protein [Thiomicrorhabdus lithotrophica]